jgi:hypothetical protein
VPLPGSWISATYLLKNKFKALKNLLIRAKYTIKRERVLLFPCLKILPGHISRGGLHLTITSKGVV